MEDINAFGVLAGRLGLRLHYADVAAMGALAERLAPLGVTPARATAIVYIGAHEGCDQITLGRALGINRASAMRVVDELEALGALERRAGRDRRSNALYLTEAGQRLHQDVEAATLAHDQVFFVALSAAEKQELGRLLTKLRKTGGAPEAASPTASEKEPA